jgi:hypothetical protein
MDCMTGVRYTRFAFAFAFAFGRKSSARECICIDEMKRLLETMENKDSLPNPNDVLWKRDNIADFAGTIGVVPIGAWHGTGRNARQRKVAVYDEDEGV